MDHLNLSEAEIEKQTRDEADRSHFVQELLLSMLSASDAAGDNRAVAVEKAIPVQCASLSISASNETKEFQLGSSDGPILSNKKANTSFTNEDSKDIFTYAGGNKNLVESFEYQPEEPPRRFANASVQISRDSDDEDRPPSPKPLGHLLQASRVYAAGSVSVGGFPQAAAQLGNYGREDVGSGNITKHMH